MTSFYELEQMLQEFIESKGFKLHSSAFTADKREPHYRYSLIVSKSSQEEETSYTHDVTQQFNRSFTEFMHRFDAGDRPMVKKLIREIFRYPLSDRVYFRMSGYKATPRHAFNDCNSNQNAIDSDLKNLVALGLAEKTEGGWRLIVG